MPLLIFLAFIPIFWLLIVRPQQQQRRAHQEVVAALAVGQRVMTVGGLIGTIVELDDELVQLDTGGGAVLTFGRTFVRQQVPELGKARTDAAEPADADAPAEVADVADLADPADPETAR